MEVYDLRRVILYYLCIMILTDCLDPVQNGLVALLVVNEPFLAFSVVLMFGPCKGYYGFYIFLCDFLFVSP